MAGWGERPSRKNNRLKGYDYSRVGYYFVTICTQNRIEYFGKIDHGEMVLNEYGTIVRDQWLWLAKQYDYVELGEYVVMPNHFHGILFIYNEEDPCRDRSRPVPTEKIKSLSELIGAFKTISSKLVHRNGLENFAWQRSFYDHIIYGENALQNIRAYIINNPLNWNRDRNNNL